MHKDKIDLIRRVAPELTLKTVQFIESGFHSLAVVVDGEWIFRFPLSPRFYGEYITEEKILNHIGPHVTAPVPELTVYDVEGVIFTKHRLIHGEQYFEAGKGLTPVQKDVLARDVAAFMVGLHEVECTDMPISQFSPEEYQAHEKNRPFSDFFDKEQSDKLRKVLRDFDEKSRKLDSRNAVLCHTDLNENNFLIQNGRLCGVIDFGNACRRDYSSEFATLLKHDFPFTCKIAECYEIMTEKTVDLRYAVLLQKIRCYGGIMENPQHADRYYRWLMYLEKHEDEI